MASSPGCTACVFPGYPEQYPDARRQAAIPVAILTVVLYFGGLALFLARRRESLIASRHWQLTVIASVSILFCLHVPYREYFGEASVSCVIQALFPNLVFAISPACLIVRFFSLYAQHLRQRVVYEMTGVEECGSVVTDERNDPEPAPDGERYLPLEGPPTDMRPDGRGGSGLSTELPAAQIAPDSAFYTGGTCPRHSIIASSVPPALSARTGVSSGPPDSAAITIPISRCATGGTLSGVAVDCITQDGAPAFLSSRDKSGTLAISDEPPRSALPSGLPRPAVPPSELACCPCRSSACADAMVGVFSGSENKEIDSASSAALHMSCCTRYVSAFYTYLDAIVVYLRLHTVRSQVLFLAVLCTPRIAYYIARLIVTPEYRTWSAVGCRLDHVDMASFIAITLPFFVLTLPLLVRLRAQHDSLGIRYELAAQLACFPPFVVWYFYGKYTNSDITDENGEYSGIGIMLAIVLTSLWAPALVSFQARDMPRKARVLPLDSNLRNSGRFADIVASTAGQLIVNEIVVSDLVDDAPTIPRLLRVLQTPPRRILQQSGDLAVVAALLVGSSWGLRVMKTLVMQELAGEPLAFIRAAAALRTFSQAVIAPSAEAGTPRTPTLLRNPIRAPPIVAISICSPQPHVPLQVPICSPQPDAPLPSAATPRLEQPMMPAVDLPTQDASPALLTPPRAGHSSRPRRPTVTRQTSLSGISSHLHRLMSRYVAEGSPMQVTISSGAVAQLRAAQAELEASSASDAVPAAGVAAVDALSLALRAAERELFETLVRGPVFRFVQQRRKFAVWALEARTVLTATRSHRGV